MILAEVVLCSIGVQVKVMDHNEYGRDMTYFGINAGVKADLPGPFKKLLWNFHLNIGIKKYCYGIGLDAWPSYLAIEAACFKWYWRKAYGKGVQHERKV